MDGQRFDDLVRTLATGTSRRRLLKGIGGLSGIFAARTVTPSALAQPAPADTCYCHQVGGPVPNIVCSDWEGWINGHFGQHGNDVLLCGPNPPSPMACPAGELPGVLCCDDSECDPPETGDCGVGVCFGNQCAFGGDNEECDLCEVCNLNTFACDVVANNCNGVCCVAACCGTACCGPGEVCSIGATPVCCTPDTCNDLPGQCGVLPNGCGGTVTCTCPSGDCCLESSDDDDDDGVCCPAGDVCLDNGTCCTPDTCDDLQPGSCGTFNDGCGTIICECNPTGCADSTCEAGFCVYSPDHTECPDCQDCVVTGANGVCTALCDAEDCCDGECCDNACCDDICCVPGQVCNAQNGACCTPQPCPTLDVGGTCNTTFTDGCGNVLTCPCSGELECCDSGTCQECCVDEDCTILQESGSCAVAVCNEGTCEAVPDDSICGACEICVSENLVCVPVCEIERCCGGETCCTGEECCCDDGSCHEDCCVEVCESDEDCGKDNCCCEDGSCSPDCCPFVCKSDHDCEKDTCCCDRGSCSADCCEFVCKADTDCAKGTCCCEDGSCSATCCPETGCKADAECADGYCCCDNGSCSTTCCGVTKFPATGTGPDEDGSLIGAALLAGAAAVIGAKVLRKPGEESSQ